MNKFIRNFLSKGLVSHYYILLLDILIMLFSFSSIYLIQFGFNKSSHIAWQDLLLLLSLLIVINTVFFFVFRTFKGIIRFSSFTDLLKVLYTLNVGYLVSFLVYLALNGFAPVSSSFFVMYIAMFFQNIVLMLLVRILVKEIYQRTINSNKWVKNVFIYGINADSISLTNALRLNLDVRYQVLGFIAENVIGIGKRVNGVAVYPNNNNIFNVLKTKRVETIIISSQKMKEIKDTEVLARFIDNNITLLTASPLEEWHESSDSKEQIRDVQIEDLLPRMPITINTEKIEEHIGGKCVLITGAAGSIGREIARQVIEFSPSNLILIDQAETPLHDLKLELGKTEKAQNIKFIVANIGDAIRLENIFKRAKPDYVFHAAAYKHVPMMEDNVSGSVQNNVLGTKILADLAVKYDVSKFVMISTDKAVNPSNIMGCSKRICEIYVQALSSHLYTQTAEKSKTQFITTRFGNVLGSNGSVIPFFKEQIKKGGPVTVTHPEIIRYFMTIPEACQLVLEAGAMGSGGEIYIFDMGKPIKIYDLALRMIKLSGSKDIKIEFSGLRPGEKLYEELLNISEHTKPTHNEKIMIANVQEYEYKEISKLIDNLIEVSYDCDDLKTVTIMKQIVPEFKSLNSPFEVLDKI